MGCPTKCSGVRLRLARYLATPAALLLIMGGVGSSAVTGRERPDVTQQRFQNLYPQVQAARGCTQEDAPAVEIYFFVRQTASGEPVEPFVRVEISGRARDIIPPAKYRLMPLRRNIEERRRIVRAELVEKRGSSVWLDGTIAIRADNPETGIAGRVDMISPTKQAWSRTFSARYVRRQALCG